MYNKSNLIVQQMLNNDRHSSMKQANNSFRRELNDGSEDNVSDEIIAQRNAQYPPLGSKEAAMILASNPAQDELNESLEREVDKYFDPIRIDEESKDVAE